MSDQQTARAPRRAEIAAIAAEPASFWVASLACVALIVGGVAQWATAFGWMTVSGTDMHGWNEVAVGVAGLALLAVRLAFGVRLPLLLAAIAGALGAAQAGATLSKIGSDGAVSVLGFQYRYLQPSWGLYLVLAGGIALACAAAMTWAATRPRRSG